MWAAWQHFIAAIFSAEYLMSMQTIAWAINQRVLWCEELQWLTHTPSKTTSKQDVYKLKQTCYLCQCIHADENPTIAPAILVIDLTHILHICDLIQWSDLIHDWNTVQITSLWSSCVCCGHPHYILYLFESLKVFVQTYLCWEGVLVLVRPVKSLPKTIYKDPFPRPLSSTHTHTHIYYHLMQKKVEKVCRVSTRNMLNKKFHKQISLNGK